MNFQPIKKTRAYEQVIEQIFQTIDQGLLQPGDRLPSERNLAEQLQTSRSVIREAMIILQNDEVIDIRPGIGIFLKENETELILEQMEKTINQEVHGERLLQLLEVRQGIEAQSAYLAAQSAHPTDLENIYTKLLNLENAVRNGKIGAEEDLAFHLAIGEASQNELIVELLQVISDRFLASLRKTRIELKKRNRVEEFIDEHREIYNAIVAKDAEKARMLMTLQIENMKKFHSQVEN